MCVWLEITSFARFQLELPVTGKFAWSVPNWGKLCSSTLWVWYVSKLHIYFFLFGFRSLQTDTNYLNNYVYFQRVISSYKMSESQGTRDRLETFYMYTVVFYVAISTKHNFLQATGYVSGKMICRNGLFPTTCCEDYKSTEDWSTSFSFFFLFSFNSLDFWVLQEHLKNKNCVVHLKFTLLQSGMKQTYNI